MLREKAKICQLFANIFAKEPTVEFLKELQSEDNERLLELCEIDFLSDIKNLPLDKQAETLSVEYSRLFLRGGSRSSPHESLQLGEGRFWGESTVEVNSIYKKFGYELDESFKDMPDHLSAELSFLSELYLLEKKYVDDGIEESAEGVRQVRKYFLEKHLLKWLFKFRDEIIEFSQFSYYREAAKFIVQFLNTELEELAVDPCV